MQGNGESDIHKHHVSKQSYVSYEFEARWDLALYLSIMNHMQSNDENLEIYESKFE